MTGVSWPGPGRARRAHLRLCAFIICQALGLISPSGHAQPDAAALDPTSGTAQPNAAELWAAISKIVATPDVNITSQVVENAFHAQFTHRYDAAMGSLGKIVHEHLYRKSIDRYFATVLSTSDSSAVSLFTFTVDFNYMKNSDWRDQLPCIRRSNVESDVVKMGWVKDPTVNDAPFRSHSSIGATVTEVYNKPSSNPKAHLKLQLLFGLYGIDCLNTISADRSIY
jgi:hypothetical protein